MNFDFDEQQYEFRDVFARYLAEALPLARHEADAAKGPGTYDELWKGLSELGLFALLVPEEHGGLGLGFVDVALIVEELGRALAPVSVTDTLIATDILVRFGDDDLRTGILPSIASGETRIALATSETAHGYDLTTCSTELTSGRRVSGRKILVAHGEDATAFLVSAREQNGRIALALVPRDEAGVSLRAHAGLDPASLLTEVTFERAPVMALLKGAEYRLLDLGATIAAGLQIGISGNMLDRAVDYAKTRVQFGKPIGSFQTIKHRCADMAVSHDGSRSAAYYAFWAIAEDAPDRARAASIAKAFCGEAVRSICNESLQVHGGMGFTWELGLHHYLRRAKLLEYQFGNADYHRERALGQTLAQLDHSNVCSGVKGRALIDADLNSGGGPMGGSSLPLTANA